MLTMSTLMMPAHSMTAMSAPGPLQVPTKLEPNTKLSINHNNTTNKAGMWVIRRSPETLSFYRDTLQDKNEYPHCDRFFETRCEYFTADPADVPFFFSFVRHTSVLMLSFQFIQKKKKPILLIEAFYICEFSTL